MNEFNEERNVNISVAMATYNGAPYIEAQITSILTQTVLPNEIVISDDGSSDNTIEIINTIATTSKVPISFDSKMQMY